MPIRDDVHDLRAQIVVYNRSVRFQYEPENLYRIAGGDVQQLELELVVHQRIQAIHNFRGLGSIDEGP